MTTKDIQISMPSHRTLSLYDFVLLVLLVFTAGATMGAIFGPFAILVSGVVAIFVVTVQRLQAPKKAAS